MCNIFPYINHWHFVSLSFTLQSNMFWEARWPVHVARRATEIKGKLFIWYHLSSHFYVNVHIHVTWKFKCVKLKIACWPFYLLQETGILCKSSCKIYAIVFLAPITNPARMVTQKYCKLCVKMSCMVVGAYVTVLSNLCACCKTLRFKYLQLYYNKLENKTLSVLLPILMNLLKPYLLQNI